MSLHVNYTVDGNERSAFFEKDTHPQTELDYTKLKEKLSNKHAFSTEKSITIRSMSESSPEKSDLLLG